MPPLCIILYKNDNQRDFKLFSYFQISIKHVPTKKFRQKQIVPFQEIFEKKTDKKVGNNKITKNIVVYSLLFLFLIELLVSISS